MSLDRRWGLTWRCDSESQFYSTRKMIIDEERWTGATETGGRRRYEDAVVTKMEKGETDLWGQAEQGVLRPCRVPQRLANTTVDRLHSSG